MLGLDISAPIPHSVFTDSYSENSYLADQDLGRSIPTPCVSNDNFTDSYSESSYLAHQVLGDLPSQMAILKIPTLGTHISQVRSGHIYSYPPQWFHRLLLWEFLFRQPGLGRSNPSLCLKWQFHRFLLWELIFGRSGLSRSILSNGNVTDSYSEGSYLAGQVLADLPPPLSAHFTDSYSESSYLDNQVLVDPTPLSVSNDNFTDSYSDSSYLADQVLVDLSSQMAMSQIPKLRAHIWQTRSWQIFHPPPKEWFHRFLLWELIFGRSGLDISTPIPPSDFTNSYPEGSYLGGQVFAYLPSPHPNSDFTDSYSESSYLADQVLGDLFSQMAMSEIPPLRAHIW